MPCVMITNISLASFNTDSRVNTSLAPIGTSCGATNVAIPKAARPSFMLVASLFPVRIHAQQKHHILNVVAL